KRLLVFCIVGQEIERGADQRTGVAEFRGYMMEAGGELDVLGARHQHSERNCLGVSISEGFIGRLRKEQLPPIRREIGESFAFHGKLLCHFVTQQPAEAGRGVSQIPCTSRRNGLPTQEALEEYQKARGSLQFAAR